AVAPITATQAWIALSPAPGSADGNLAWRVARISREGGADPFLLPPNIAAAAGEIATLLQEGEPGREILWIGGSTGLLRVDLARLAPALAPPVAAIRHVEPAFASGFVLPHDHAPLRVEFSAP